jgi:uncharacterized metal-binding protein
MSNDPHCASCPHPSGERYCRAPGGKAPEDCPSIHYKELAARAREIMADPELREFARQASIQEATCYVGGDRGREWVRPVKPRIVETIEFARRLDCRRLGLVFCIGLRNEAAVVARIFEDNGFEVVSACCKVGREAKEEALGLADDEKIVPGGFESMCNPVLQAMLMNECGAELNVLLGLCVGHDSLFLRHAEAWTTVLAVKDRLLGHNPLAAIYQYDSYWASLKKPVE